MEAKHEENGTNFCSDITTKIWYLQDNMKDEKTHISHWSLDKYFSVF